MMNTAAKRRKAYREAFCNHPDNEGAIKMADLLYGDYYPKRNKEKAFLDALEGAGKTSGESIEWWLDRAEGRRLSCATSFNWSHSKQGRAFWLFLVRQVEEAGKPFLV